MKNKIAKIKKTAKHYAPELLGCTALAGLAASVYIYKDAMKDIEDSAVYMQFISDAETGEPKYLLTSAGNFSLTPYEED